MFERMRQLVLKRRMAYRAVFAPGGERTVAAQDVLADLRKFCRATTTPAVISNSGSIDPIATGVAIGRLEVWHRITQHLHISDADLYRMVENNDNQDQ